MKTSALFTLALAALLSVGGATAKTPSRKGSKSGGATVRTVYSMVGCPQCVVVKRALSRKGARLSHSYTGEFQFESYPTVIYSDGRSDQGQRILAGRVSIPKSVRVVEAE